MSKQDYRIIGIVALLLEIDSLAFVNATINGTYIPIWILA
jgi:hypothetical protein